MIHTIGDLRATLREMDPESEVFIDNRRPTALSSYRGYYEDLAIERTSARYERTELNAPGKPFDLPRYGAYQPGSSEVQIKADPTVADLLEALDLADGATFEGYKGGQFEMGAASRLWVSECGDCDHLRIIGAEVLRGRVDFVTREVDW